MINPATLDKPIFTALRYGFRVDRPAAALPATGAAPLFTVMGGRVAAYFVGEVTTAIQNQACNTKLIHNPATGTDTDLCAVLDIAADEVGTQYTITGTPATALLGAGQSVRITDPVILTPGTVDLSTAATNTGAVKWSCFYVPIDDGAAVEVA